MYVDSEHVMKSDDELFDVFLRILCLQKNSRILTNFLMGLNVRNKCGFMCCMLNLLTVMQMDEQVECSRWKKPQVTLSDLVMFRLVGGGCIGRLVQVNEMGF